jgi:hypothetical protein
LTLTVFILADQEFSPESVNRTDLPMKFRFPLPRSSRHSLWLSAAVLTLAGNCFFGARATASPTDTNAAPAAASAPAKKSLTGAELYSIHCNRCHPERYPTERTAAQWKTIMLHMQVRASIPARQAKLILQYLQDNSGR